MCRRIDVTTPEDPYPVWHGAEAPVLVAALFLLYDYSFLVPGCAGKDASLAAARRSGTVCADEYLLHPDPFPTREAWCQDRVAMTERRLNAEVASLPLLAVNHWPLRQEPTRHLAHPEFAPWCGTTLTADWAERFGIKIIVYGHLHMAGTAIYNGVRYEEVSLGYPNEWSRTDRRHDVARVIET